MSPEEMHARMMEAMAGPPNLDKLWKLLEDCGEHKIVITMDQGGHRRSIILVQGAASVKRASALLEDL